ncbi:uracil-DNA glycosylase family protein [Streptococcus thoraltensis]|uniref:uracil-DNA glycosylase family protein n=1 Tax=Streptococcus thoraltensis TaxID=55085 RepID=UPI0004760157|nr:uracil-DNA glycosylase family protein [Streptococcus thoraltensis]MDY4761402.1 uracil-DNA glycosylase family protein [Streptococcus thoraltensis]
MIMTSIYEAIKEDKANQSYTNAGIEPLYQVSERAKVLLIGQAPGIKAQNKQKLFQDPSGDRLREWLGVDEEFFYESGQIAILPMDFYFPGKGKSGDLPPRKGQADKWHPQLLKEMPGIKLTLLIGKAAQDYYLADKKTLTDRVADYQDYLPDYFPLPHPSPRNNIWLSRHPWFAEELLPDLQNHLTKIFGKNL